MTRKPRTSSPLKKRYILLPLHGATSPRMAQLAASPGFVRTLAPRAARPDTSPSYTLLQSWGETRPKLIETTEEGLLALRIADPDLRVFEERFYAPARFEYSPARFEAQRRPARARAKPAAAAAAAVTQIKVT